MFKSPYLQFLLVTATTLTVPSLALAQNNLTAKSTTPQAAAVVAAGESDRVKDGLAGPVRRVRTEIAKLLNTNGQSTEGKRVVLETAAYDTKGTKIENQYFPVVGASLTGKEVYKYDERGNISEMTLLNADGSLLGKEVYKYDYDSVGNWTRMTTSVAVVEGGKVTFEPTEVTYRAITYYLDENVLKLAQGSPAAAENAKPVISSPAVTPPKAQPNNKPADNKTVTVNHAVTAALPTVSSATHPNANSASVLSSNGGPTSASTTTNVVIDAPPPPATNAPKPLLKPVSGGVLNGKALYLPAPIYPESAKRMRIMGVVVVDVVVDENGKVISAQASSGPPTLRDVAAQAAAKAKFSPTKLSGQPVKVTGAINYKFSLSQ